MISAFLLQLVAVYMAASIIRALVGGRSLLSLGVSKNMKSKKHEPESADSDVTVAPQEMFTYTSALRTINALRMTHLHFV